MTQNAWNIEEADAYIVANTLDNEDWLDSDETRKTALLNVSKRTLARKFTKHEISNEAIYIFANVLSYSFNDTMIQAQRGVASFSIRGIAFTFKDWMKTDMDDLIPDEVYDIIGVPKRRAKYTIL